MPDGFWVFVALLSFIACLVFGSPFAHIFPILHGMFICHWWKYVVNFQSVEEIFHVTTSNSCNITFHLLTIFLICVASYTLLCPYNPQTLLTEEYSMFLPAYFVFGTGHNPPIAVACHHLNVKFTLHLVHGRENSP